MRRASAVAAVVAAASVLPACGPKENKADVPRLLAELRSSDSARSGQARLELLKLGEPAVPALAEMLRSGTPADRISAANTLWGMGPRGRGAVPELAAALGEADAELRVAAAMALETIGVPAAPAVPSLVAAIRDSDVRVRQAAVKALGSIGPAAEDALPDLTRVLRRESWPEAEEAVRRIRGLAPGAPLELGPDPGPAQP